MPRIKSIVRALSEIDKQAPPKCCSSPAFRILPIKLRPLLAIFQATELLSQFSAGRRYPLHLQVLLVGGEYLAVIQAMAKILQSQLLRGC